MSLSTLPLLNALLNAASACLLVTGWILVRRGEKVLHRRVMTAAVACSALFLVSYLTYHSLAGTTRFGGTGAIRTVYFTLLSVHTVLAALVAPLAITTFVLARRGRFARHRKLARYVLPLWLVVSVTGVAVYLFLRPYYPRAGAALRLPHRERISPIFAIVTGLETKSSIPWERQRSRTASDPSAVSATTATEPPPGSARIPRVTS